MVKEVYWFEGHPNNSNEEIAFEFCLVEVVRVKPVSANSKSSTSAVLDKSGVGESMGVFENELVKVLLKM